jgi:DNA-binding transcriptional LysR family regulator
MLSIGRLRLLHELEARGTVTAVAQALSFTPSAVSQQLARLEQETGIALFEKIGRRLHLTDAGRVLAAHADTILAAVDAAASDLATADGEVRGRIRVGAFQSAAHRLLVPTLDHLGIAYPRLEVEVVEADPEETVPALVLGDLDLVFFDEYDDSAPFVNPALDREHLLDDDLRVVLPSDDPLAALDTIQLGELADRSWASGQKGSSYTDAVEAACRRHGSFVPHVAHRTSDLLLLISLVGARRAVAILPDLSGADRNPRVAVRPIAGARLGRKIYTGVRRSSRQRPAVLALRRALRDALKLEAL